jgi:hypothetical protein
MRRDLFNFRPQIDGFMASHRCDDLGAEGGRDHLVQFVKIRVDSVNILVQHHGRIKAPKGQKRFDVALNFQRSGVSIIAVQIDAVGVEPDARERDRSD